MRWIAIAAMGACGSLARYALGGWISDQLGAEFPWGTLIINVSGSVALGFLFVVLTQRLNVDPALRVGIITGFLGGYTTFSTFSLETARLAQTGSTGAAALNVCATVGFGLAGVGLGIIAGRAVM